MSCGPLKRQHNSLLEGYSAQLGGAILHHRVEVAERVRRVEVERANIVISQFIANMSHELRTPLNAIIGFSKFMQDVDKYDLSEEQIKEYSGFIYEGSVNLLEVINEILEFSKFQSGNVVEDVQDIDLSEVLSSCIAAALDQENAGKPSIIEEIDPDLPMLRADMFRVKQIFTAILQNALKWLPSGRKIEVSARYLDRNFVKVCVTDLKEILSSEEIHKGMETFAVVNAEFSEVEKGTGLGLSIANAVIDSLGGSMEIFRDLKTGTAVVVNLPVDWLNASLCEVTESVSENCKTEGLENNIENSINSNSSELLSEQADVFEDV